MRGFAQVLSLGFGPLWLGRDVRTLAHSYTSYYMKCYMEWLIAGCNIVMGERKTELSIAYLVVDMTKNILSVLHIYQAHLSPCDIGGEMTGRWGHAS